MKIYIVQKYVEPRPGSMGYFINDSVYSNREAAAIRLEQVEPFLGKGKLGLEVWQDTHIVEMEVKDACTKD